MHLGKMPKYQVLLQVQQLLDLVFVFLHLPEGKHNMKVQIQASIATVPSPLQAEAAALVLAARIAQHLQLQQVTFLTDNLTLARAAADKKLASDKIHWEIRKDLANYLLASKGLQPQVYHISRDLNGIAHSVAHQVLNSSTEHVFCCSSSAHRNRECLHCTLCKHSGPCNPCCKLLLSECIRRLWRLFTVKKSIYFLGVLFLVFYAILFLVYKFF